MKKQKWFAALLLGAVLGASACGSDEPTVPTATAPSSSSAASATGTPGGSDGDTDPPDSVGKYNDQYNFTATTFDGETFELATYKGTPVVINFWESW